MRIPRFRQWLSLLILLASATFAAAEDSGSIAGVVRDGEGKPLSGVSIVLTTPQTPPSTRQTTSNLSGEYRFAAMAAGVYTIAAQLSGYDPAAPVAVRLPPASAPVTVNLTMTRTASVQELGGFSPVDQANVQPSASHPALEFQSAGIRGLIDPGGYSASTSGAATGLLRGIADVKRTNKNFGASLAKDWPCNLEPQLRKAVAEHPDLPEANRRLGQFYAAHRLPAKAIPLLQHALAFNADDYAAARELAIALLATGDFDRARQLLTPLVEHHTIAEIHQILARADEGLGQFQQAVNQYRIAEGLEPSEESLFGAGYEMLLAGQGADAVAVFQTGANQYPRSIPLRIGLGTALFYQGKTADALHSFLDAADIDPADPRPYSFVSSLSGIEGNESDRARDSFKRFLDLKPTSAAANYYYALALVRQGATPDTSRIETLLKKAIQLDPNLAKAHLQLADLYAQRNDDAEAVPEYEAAVRLAQDLGEAHYRLAMAYKRTGKADLSAREMQIFRLSKEKQAGESDGIDIAQFVSVMDAPNQQPTEETQCPASSR